MNERRSTARHDAFLDGSTGRRQGVLYAVLLLFELHLGRGTDLDDGNTAGQLGQPLLQLLAIEVAGGLGDLSPNLLDAAFDGLFGAAALDDRRLVLVGH